MQANCRLAGPGIADANGDLVAVADEDIAQRIVDAVNKAGTP